MAQNKCQPVHQVYDASCTRTWVVRNDQLKTKTDKGYSQSSVLQTHLSQNSGNSNRVFGPKSNKYTYLLLYKSNFCLIQICFSGPKWFNITRVDYIVQWLSTPKWFNITRVDYIY